MRTRNREDRIPIGHHPDAVDHRTHTAWRGRTERPAEHGAEVVLELARLGAFDRPVAAVVHPGGHLIGEQVPLELEELDAPDAHVVERIEEWPDAGLGPRLERGVEARRGR